MFFYFFISFYFFQPQLNTNCPEKSPNDASKRVVWALGTFVYINIYYTYLPHHSTTSAPPPLPVSGPPTSVFSCVMFFIMFIYYVSYVYILCFLCVSIMFCMFIYYVSYVYLLCFVCLYIMFLMYIYYVLYVYI